MISQGKTVALDRWGGKWNHPSMTHRLTTDYVKSYCNRTLTVQIIQENVVTCLFSGTQCTAHQRTVGRWLSALWRQQHATPCHHNECWLAEVISDADGNHNNLANIQVDYRSHLTHIPVQISLPASRGSTAQPAQLKPWSHLADLEADLSRPWWSGKVV